MDSFNLQNIKVEKANAKIRYRRLQKVTALFRLIELCVFLIILSRFSTLLPIAFKLSGENFRGLFLSLIGPRFVFILGNVIVIILFLKSGQSSAQESTTYNRKIDFYDEYVESCQRNSIVHTEESNKQKKKSMCVERAAITDTYSYTEKRIRRSCSQKLKSLHCKEPRHVLRRSVTERCLETVNNGDRTVATSFPVDEMSNEEFRSRVEAFIARQQRLIKEEEEEFTASVDLAET